MKAERIKSTLTDAMTVQVPARMPAWVVPLVKTALLVVDLALAFAAFAYAFHIRQGSALVHTGVGGGLAWTRAFAPYGALLILVVPIRAITLAYYDLYRLRGEFSFVEDAIRVFKATAIGSLLIVAGAFLYRGGFEFSAL
jgi:hypothetical protein